MFSLFKKDLKSFFSSLTGYIVIGIFLLINGLFIWVFPGQYNVMDVGYANLDTLFFFAPWVLLFLVPAVTMRLFSEESKAGTMELLLTKPLSDLEIVLAKYFSALTLVLFSVLPSLIYFVSVWLLGNPPGSIDTGGTWGSYIGLFFLGSIYVAIGLFCSALTDNQIVSFILTVVLAFFAYIGFDAIGSLPGLRTVELFILNLGINEHYQSMSRGVIDSKDMIYFICVNLIFILFTRLKIESRKW